MTLNSLEKLSVIVRNMDAAYTVFLKVLRGYGFKLDDLQVTQIHSGTWVLVSDEGIWYLKFSNEFFHLAGEQESIDFPTLAKVSKSPMINYMTIIFAHPDMFYRISYEKFLKVRTEYHGAKDGIPRYLIPKSELSVWHVIT